MNSIENAIKDVISQKLESGLVEKLVAEQLEVGIKKALEDIFGGWGSGTKAIKEKIESVMVPVLDGYDYSRYIVKLDVVLGEVLRNCTDENRLLMENFKSLATVDNRKEIKASDLFKIWCDHVAKNVETNGLEVDFDDSPSYECVEVTGRFKEDEKSSWSSSASGRLVFECEHDEDMNFEIQLNRWITRDDERWDINNRTAHDIASLRHLNPMEVTVLRLMQSGVKVIIDEDYMDEMVRPDAEPEANFS